MCWGTWPSSSKDRSERNSFWEMIGLFGRDYVLTRYSKMGGSFSYTE